jgi:hypothetical protein
MLRPLQLTYIANSNPNACLHIEQSCTAAEDPTSTFHLLAFCINIIRYNQEYVGFVRSLAPPRALLRWAGL